MPGLKFLGSKFPAFNFRDIAVYRIPTGPLLTNAYLLVKGDQSLLIDPGNDADELAELIKETKSKLQAILVTHLHWDHIGAVEALRKNVAVYWNPEGNDILPLAQEMAAQYNISLTIPTLADKDLLPGKHQIGNFKFKALETSGHAPGHLSFYFSEGFVLTGDSLVKNATGRVDLPGGNGELLIKNIKEQLLTLPAQTVVLAGHLDETTIESEIKNNPFVK